MKKKKTILIDLDRILNKYNGVFDRKNIPEATAETREFIQKMSMDFKIKLFTRHNRILAAKWLIKNDLEIYISGITKVKKFCWVFVDDRCIQFDRDYENLRQTILNFKPWYKKLHNKE